MKKGKKYVLGIVGIVVIVAGAFFGWGWYNCPQRQFKEFCKEEFCPYFCKRLTKEEKKDYVIAKKYLKETGKQALDAEGLKLISADNLNEILLKQNAAKADFFRQKALDNLTREKFSGDYMCIRNTWTNGLSNDEVLFLQDPRVQNLNVLRDAALKSAEVRQIYINASAKIIRCTDQATQQQYVGLIKQLTPVIQEEKKPAPAKKKAKKATKEAGEEKKEEKKD